MATPWVEVVKPTSPKPIPPSLYDSAVVQLLPPSVDRYRKLAPEAAATTMVSEDRLTASASASPPVGAVPATWLTPPVVSTTDFMTLPAAGVPLHKV